MGKIFVTSDIWFNRPTGKKSECNTNEYNDMIINNWNKTVGKRDIVYILGGLGVGDLYHLLVKLNGEIHIMNNLYSQEELYFMDNLVKTIDHSVDKKLKNKFIFTTNQIMSIPSHDAILTYLPLMDWVGSETGVYCFHGLRMGSDLAAHRISCAMEEWDFKPIEIQDIQENIKKFSQKV